VSTLPAHSPAAPPPAPGDLVRFVEPAGRRRNRVGTVERQISRGRHRGALVIRVAGEARRYVLPADRLRRMAGAAAQEPPPPEATRQLATPAPIAPPASPAPAERQLAPPAPIAGEPLRLFD
jgi:hypothetical protein